ncbi:MAG: ribosome hibernation-promoting factor, HPF/YfiA family [Polyangiales bacterium]
MHIEFTFHQMEPSDAIKAYAQDKLSKLEKYFRAPLDAQVRFSLEGHLHCVDVGIGVGGERHQGRAQQEDMYASIDVVVDKIQRQIHRAKEQHSNHRRGPLPGDTPGE